MPDYEKLDAIARESTERWVEELAEFCRIPSEGTNLAALHEAAEWTKQRLERLGAEVREYALPDDPAVPPLIVGEIGPGPRTLNLVQHYDVQPAVPLHLWTTPPYASDVRDGRLYARGATDNKGEFMSRVWGVEAYLAAFGTLPCRVRFLVEGEEESGSRNLDRLLDLDPDLRKADGALIEGGGVTADGPWIDCGVRGILVVELVARTASSDVHSSLNSIIPNAATRLVAALATLHDAEGRPAIDGLRDQVRQPTPEARQAARDLPIEELQELKEAYGVPRFIGGIDGADANERKTFEPTANIQGLWAGFTGPGVKTVLPAEAHVRLDFRLVPDQTPEGVLEALRGHLERRGFGDIGIAMIEGEHPYWSPVDHPIVAAATRASQEVFGGHVSVAPSMAGTAPMWQICGRDGVPTVSLGGGRDDCMAHAPDENYRVSDSVDAARITARFLDGFAAIDR